MLPILQTFHYFLHEICQVRLGFPDALEPIDIQAIIRTAREAEPNLTNLMKKVVERL